VKVVLFNGPPRSGKDTIVETLMSRYKDESAHLKLSKPLKQSLKTLFNLSEEEADYLEQTKDTPSDLLFGMSWRQAQIWLSEDVMKPQFGKSIFGKLLVKDLDSTKKFTFISDSGFLEEAEEIIKAVGANNVIKFSLWRDGCSFKGDSRSYWSTYLPIKDISIENNSTIADVVGVIQEILNDNI
jgi:hypothetical protein